MIFQVIKPTGSLKVEYPLNESTDLYQVLDETHMNYQMFFRKDPCTHADTNGQNAQIFANQKLVINVCLMKKGLKFDKDPGFR